MWTVQNKDHHLKLNTSSFYVIYLGFGTGVKLHNKHSFMYSFFCFSPFRPCTDYSERERDGVQKNCWSKGWWGECSPSCPFFVIILLLLQIACGQNGEKALSMGEYRQYCTIIFSQLWIWNDRCSHENF